MPDEQIKLTNLISPAYYDLHNDIKNNYHTYYDIYGGRGSVKSSNVSIEIILAILADKNASCAVFRKVGETLRESVYSQIGWAIEQLGLTSQFKVYTYPLKYVYMKTGQVITFHGLDKARKTKSVKCPHGYYKILQFEELDEFDGATEIRTVEQSYLRGGDKFIVFKTFNPPISINNWANEYVLTPDKRAYRIKTDYRSVPRGQLGEVFLQDAEHLKAVNERAYKHEYLGEPIGLGNDVFDNLEIRTITDDEIKGMERFYNGQDWGQSPDPKAFLRCSYNHNKEEIYAIKEAGGTKIPVIDMAKKIIEMGYNDVPTICGADELESIHDYVSLGIHAYKTDNRPGSIKYEMEWLQTRKIVIDPNRTPELYHEIINYAYDVDSAGRIIASYPDRDNHYIDALRYATSQISLKRTPKLMKNDGLL